MAKNSSQSVKGSLPRKQVFMVFTALLALGTVSLALISVWKYEHGKMLADEVFHLPGDTAGGFLSEAVALEYANQLLMQKFPSVAWKPVEDDGNVAATDRKERFLLRNVMHSSNEGSILFVNMSPGDTIPNRVSARLSLRDHDLTCVLSRAE